MRRFVRFMLRCVTIAQHWRLTDVVKAAFGSVLGSQIKESVFKYNQFKRRQLLDGFPTLSQGKQHEPESTRP